MPSTKMLLALALFTAAYALPTPQLAGEGAASNSVFSSTDNGVGHGLENALNNLAALITSAKSGTSTARSLDRRQLDKIAKGVQQLSNAVGTGSATSALTGELVTADGQSTSGAANLGAQVGSTEESVLEGAGNATPKRQLDKIAKGLQTASNAVGTGGATSSVTTGLVNIDGTLTSGAANIGADAGSTEDATLEELGDSVPTSL